MVSQLAALDEVVGESKVVEKIVRSVSAQHWQVVLSIRTLLDVSTLTVIDILRRLKASEEVFQTPPPTMQHEGKLYMTVEEWEA